MRKLIPFLLLVACVSANAAYITITATFTNRSLIGTNFVIDGGSVIYTNAPLNTTSWIVTNNAANNATNLQRFLSRNFPKYYTRLTTATNVSISGNDVQLSFPGNDAAHFAFTTTNSLTVTQGWLVSLPWANQTETNRTNTASELWAGIGIYTTNAIPMSSPALTNHVSRTNFQLVTHKLLNLSSLSNSFVLDSVFNQGSFSNRIINAGVIVGGGITNATITNSTHGGGAFSGRITSSAIIAGGGMSNTIADGLTVTNLSSPGTGANSEKLGSGSVASAADSLALGSGANATNASATSVGNGSRAGGSGSFAGGQSSIADGSGSIAVGFESVAYSNNAVALGNGSLAQHNNSVALGVGAVTTDTNQIRLGTDAFSVSIPGELRGLVQSNVVTRGTNVINARVDFTSRANSSLANGYNSAIVLGSNTYVRLSGPSGAYTNVGFAAEQDGSFHILQLDNPALSIEIRNESGLDATAANRILTGTGGNLHFTNNPVVLPVIYDATASRWRLITGAPYR